MLAGPLADQVDHRKLAAQGTHLEGTLALSGLSRFSEMLADSRGEVQVDLTFGRGENGTTRISGRLDTEVLMICQNCLEQFATLLRCEVKTELVPAEDAIDPDSKWEPLVHPSRLVSIVELIEDDLILAVPMIPRHPAGECGIDTDDMTVQPDDNEEEGTYRPFAGLAEAVNKQNEVES